MASAIVAGSVLCNLFMSKSLRCFLLSALFFVSWEGLWGRLVRIICPQMAKLYRLLTIFRYQTLFYQVVPRSSKTFCRRLLTVSEKSWYLVQRLCVCLFVRSPGILRV